MADIVLTLTDIRYIGQYITDISDILNLASKSNVAVYIWKLLLNIIFFLFSRIQNHKNMSLIKFLFLLLLFFTSIFTKI